MTATPQLDDLLRLAGGVPLALAVIPACARPALARALAGLSNVAVLQHGWQHADRAVQGRKSEYPAGRPLAIVAAELAAGRARLKALFGPRALPVLVPPWNRFAGEFLPLLPAFGISGVSAISARRAPAMPAGLVARDVHVDLVAWRADRRFVGEGAALGGLIGHLQARRCGVEAADRPLGILTHHRIMDRATAAFLDRLVALSGAHPAIRWAATGEGWR